MNVMRTPRSVEIAITNNCNLRCRYCSHFSSPGDVNQDLPYEEWLCFFEELSRCQVMHVILQGGEPFIRDDLPILIDGLLKNRLRFRILSNGTLINNDIAAFIAATGRCDGIQVSIDGSSPETHDAFRGKGSFQNAISGIYCLLRHDVHVAVRVTVHKNNVHELEEIAKLLLEEIGIPSFSTNAASFLGLCQMDHEKIQLTARERALAMEKMLDLQEKYDGRIQATAGPLYDAVKWFQTDKLKPIVNSPETHKGTLSACKGVFSQIAVRADGIMVPCIHLSHIELGKINRDKLVDVWSNHPELNRLRDRTNIPLERFEYCHDCEYIDSCTGGCPALAYNLIGNDEHPSPDSCLKRFIEDGGLLRAQSTEKHVVKR